jgi:hypothetical protein
MTKIKTPRYTITKITNSMEPNIKSDYEYFWTSHISLDEAKEAARRYNAFPELIEMLKLSESLIDQDKYPHIKGIITNYLNSLNT